VSNGQAAFRRSALRLAASERNDDQWQDAAAQAAGALIDLARDRQVEDLRTFLSPGPSGLDVVWIVSCYQSGGVTPSDRREFDDPAGAVEFYAACGDPSHVLGEVVVGAPESVRWTALTRLGDELAFHLPDLQCVNGPNVGPSLRHWDEQLADWARSAAVAPAAPGATLGQRLDARLAVVERQQAEVLDALATVEAKLDRLLEHPAEDGRTRRFRR
jgi:hypothetical protein